MAITSNPTTPHRIIWSELSTLLPRPLPAAVGRALPELVDSVVVPVVAKGVAVPVPVDVGRGAFPVGGREFAWEVVMAY